MSNYFQHSVNNTSEWTWKSFISSKSISALIFAFLKTYCFIEIHFSFHHFFHLFILLQKKSNQNRWTKLLFLLFDYFSLRIKYQQKEKKNNNTHQNYDCTNGKEIENFIYLNWKVKINFLIKVSIFFFFFIMIAENSNCRWTMATNNHL